MATLRTLRSQLRSIDLGNGRSLSDRSVTEYYRMIHRADTFCTLNGGSLATAGPDMIVAFHDSLKRSWSTRKQARAALKHYWTIVGRKNPPLHVIRVPPKPEMVCRARTDEEARQLVKAARRHHDRFGFALTLGLFQGMRREEMARARWVDFDDVYVTIIGKGDKQRRIDLHPDVLDKLATADRTGEYVFPGRFGGHVAPATVWDWIRKIGDDAGVPNLTPHELRHTCLALQNDSKDHDMRATMEFAGHSRMETTQGYTRTKAAAMRKVMLAVDPLGERTKGRPKPAPLMQGTLFDDPEDHDDGW